MQLAHTISTSRAVPAAITIALHIVVAYGFAMSLGVVSRFSVPKDILVVDVPEVKPPPSIEQPHVDQGSLIARQDPRDLIRPPEMPEIEKKDDSQAPDFIVDRRIDVEPTIAAPTTLSSFEPPYPNLSRLRGEEGLVVVRVHISPSGAVGDVAIETSSGFSRLDDAALKAVRQWRFAPAMRGSQPIVGVKLVSIRFRLRE